MEIDLCQPEVYKIDRMFILMAQLLFFYFYSMILNVYFMNTISLVSIILLASSVFMFLYISFLNYKAISKSKNFSIKENLSYFTRS